MKEIWKDVDDYVGYYQVSNMGNVRSVDRIIRYNSKSKRKANGRIIKPSINNSGYMCVYLWVNGLQKIKLVHRLVAIAFVKNNSNKKTVNHKDCNKLNNYYKNLEWTSHKSNMRHAYRNNLINHKGEKNGNAKLDEIDIEYIMSVCHIISYAELGRIFNVHPSTISNVVNGKSWKHIDGKMD